MSFSVFETALMTRLLRLAARHKGKTFPNPLVAAAVYKGETVISTGAHRRSGGPHAEVMALKKAGMAAKGATLMITLEPCTLMGKTPPCINAIREAGITEVVFACLDPNLKQNPATPILESWGIRVRKGLKAAESRSLNYIFFKNITQKQPWIILKVGASLDGKIALSNGESKYITHEPSRKVVHRLRQDCGAVLVGAGTVAADDPELTVRFGLLNGPEPARIILDPTARLSLDAKVFRPNARVFWVLDLEANPPETPGHIRVLRLPHTGRQVQWEPLLKTLYRQGICAILVEGGQRVFTSALRAGIVDQLEISFAPTLLGGAAMSIFSPEWEVAALKDKIQLDLQSQKMIGPDLWISARLLP